MSIALETVMAGAIEGTFGVLTRSIVVASMGVSSTFIDIRTVEPIPFVTWFTRAVIRANLVVTQGILVTFMRVCQALVYVYEEEIQLYVMITEHDFFFCFSHLAHTKLSRAKRGTNTICIT